MGEPPATSLRSNSASSKMESSGDGGQGDAFSSFLNPLESLDRGESALGDDARHRRVRPCDAASARGHRRRRRHGWERETRPTVSLLRHGRDSCCGRARSVVASEEVPRQLPTGR